VTDIQFRMPSVQAFDPCEKCGTPLALVSYSVLREGTQDWEVRGGPEWLSYTAWKHPETGVVIPRMFRRHTAEQCRLARNPGSEPCESCGTPIARRDPQPPDADQYADLPKQAGVWDEDWRDIRPGVAVREWHSPKRCREARDR
jgi:hypothetical protein